MKKRLELLLEEKEIVSNKAIIYEDDIKLIHSQGNDFDAGSFRCNQIAINFNKTSPESIKNSRKSFQDPKNMEKKKKFIAIYNKVLKEVPIAMVLKTTGIHQIVIISE